MAPSLGAFGVERSACRCNFARVRRLVVALTVFCAVFVTTGYAATTHSIALFPSASTPHRQGFVRIINHSDQTGTVHITGIDDAGDEYGPVELSLNAQATVHFNSWDVEEGNPDKGIAGALGAGEGDWRLRLESELAVQVVSYIRTGDGFVTAMHEVVPSQEGLYHARFFNPASNVSQVSRLRLINSGDEAVEVTVKGRDDTGQAAPGGEVRLTLAPGEARDVSAQALEAGGEGLVGGLGDGSGKWQLFIAAGGAIEVMSLLESPMGHLSNLSGPGLRDLSEGKLELPLFLSASGAKREGFARLLNHSEASGTVRIYGIDDEGAESGPVMLTLKPGAVAHFNSTDLEQGNTAKGLVGALGAGTGSWRLRLYSELDIEALGYVRAADGFVTTMHERVRENAMRHHVAFFNPGSNASQVSRLRLVNPGEDEVAVTITGRDDDGESAPGCEVSLTLGPGEAREMGAQDLERGGEGLAGSLGDGSGKWQLFVTADGAIEVMNLLRSPTGHLVNLSASSQTRVLSETCTGPAVDIPDAALRRAVQQALGKPGGARITLVEMAGLTGLWAVGNGIHSLAGLQYATGLTWLDLENNHISDISPLARLTALNDLDLTVNQISDISPLTRLTALEELFLGYNQISDISPLVGLTAISVLHLYKNQISDVSPLARLTALEGLEIYENQISDISPLADLPALHWMFLDNNQISDISPLAGLTTLGELHLYSNKISDISPLAGLIGLYRLELHDNQISDISPLAGLTRLYRLELHDNQISDISPLAGLIGLYRLELHDNQISDIAPLAGLTTLGELHLYGNQISDIAPLAGLTTLGELHLYGNQISDIAPLAGLTGLWRLGLGQNYITDIDPLVSNWGLGSGDEVNLESNPLSDRSRHVHIPALRARGVTVTY